MVMIAQLAERKFVELEVAGSCPVHHPKMQQVANVFARNGKKLVIEHFISGFSSVGRTLHLGCRGHWFESSNPDMNIDEIIIGTKLLCVAKERYSNATAFVID